MEQLLYFLFYSPAPLRARLSALRARWTTGDNMFIRRAADSWHARRPLIIDTDKSKDTKKYDVLKVTAINRDEQRCR